MCGVAAIFAYHRAAPAADREELRRIRDAMRARGPDGAGEWLSDDGRCVLGHRRLAIIDLDRRSDQPMVSGCGRYRISYNGEIYNYRELRTDLAESGVALRTQSDSEVVLELFARDGTALFQRLRGMYAFVIHDALEQRLLLARDPFGIKPLYYADDGWSVRVASQVKALLAGGAVSRQPELAGEAGFWLWGSVPDPVTMYQEIRAVPAGHWMFVDAVGARAPVAHTDVVQPWQHAAMANAEADADHAVHEALAESVAAHQVADVPVGLFLSAGIDSCAVLAHMTATQGGDRVRAITLAFDEFAGTAEDEVPLAREVAHLFGAQHEVRRVGQDEFLADLPALFAAMDQPSIDGVNSWFVAKAAREAGLRVALSGVGGDELFGTYPSFRDLPRWRRALYLPAHVPGLGPVVRRLAMPWVRAGKLAPKAAGLVEWGGRWDGLYQLRRGLFLPHEVGQIMGPERFRIGWQRLQAAQLESRTLDPAGGGFSGSSFGRVASLESTRYLRHQLLRDADWAGMAHSVEIRTPLVDWRLHRAVAPMASAFARRNGKAGLLDARLRTRLGTRPKTGFGTAVSRWIGAAGDRHWARRWAQRVLRESGLTP